MTPAAAIAPTPADNYCHQRQHCNTTSSNDNTTDVSHHHQQQQQNFDSTVEQMRVAMALIICREW